MANPVNWFHISAKEVGPLAKFYGEAFDWKLAPRPDMGGMVFADSGKGGIQGGIAANQDGSDKSTIQIFVGTDSIEAQLERVVKAGGKPAMEKTALPPGMGWIAGFLDPAGNFVGLWQQVAPPPKAKRASSPRKPAAKKAAPKRAAAKKAAPKKAAPKRGAAKKTAKRR
jgi:predicted enzyme related to lactoylglutathione lyase